MKLYYSPGACSLAPHIALREADRAFDLERVDLKTKRTASGADYLEINRKGYVPALQLDDTGDMVLTEAPVILQYIGDLVPEKQLVPPNLTFARYHMQEWLNFISSEIHKPYGWLFAPDTPAPTQARARGKIAERLVYIDGLLVDRGYALGETFSVADCYLFVMLRWCERFDIDRTEWPNLDSYYQRVLERPTVHAALAAEGLLEQKKHHFRRSA